ncbi:MAG: prepilin-type N-terminal cleavage/methylation domain-containing protein [Pseudobacteriovorax sp.]|nr:prepilin-type N-terminal cleavage/methylation domain-containing protein [Pseudobacteriovorax sp.]
MNNKSGFSLVGVLIAVGIMGIIATALMRMQSNSFRNAKSLELRTDLEALKKELIENLDCSNTLPDDPAVACTTPRFVDIVRSNGDVFLANGGATGTKMGAYNLRAICNANQSRLVIQAQQTDDNGIPVRDPIKKRVLGFREVFRNLNLCTSSFSGPATPEQEHEEKFLEFYPTGRFSAVGGRVRLTISLINSDAACTHSLIMCGNPSGTNGSVVLDPSTSCRPQVRVTGPGGCPQTLAFLSDKVMLAKQGKNLWRVMAEDSDDFDYNDSVWRVQGTPLP